MMDWYTEPSVARPSSECMEMIARVAGLLDDHGREVAAAVVARIRSAVPDLPDDDRAHEQLDATARDSAALFTTVTRTWTDPHGMSPPHEALEFARGLARRGASIEVMLSAWRVGHAAYHELWLRALTGSGASADLIVEAIQVVSRLSFEWNDTTTAPLVVAYEEERERSVHDAAIIRSETVCKILAGDDIDPVAAGGRLGYRIGRCHLAAIIWMDKPTDSAPSGLHDAAVMLESAFGRVDQRPLIVRRTPQLADVWIGQPTVNASTLTRLRSALASTPYRVAIGNAGVDLAGFRRSHDEAQRACRVARLVRRTASLTTYADVAIIDLLTRDVAAARQLARRTLGTLGNRDDASRRLLETLQLYFEEGESFARAGRRLGVHHNTVAYRVRRRSSSPARPKARRPKSCGRRSRSPRCSTRNHQLMS